MALAAVPPTRTYASMVSEAVRHPVAERAVALRRCDGEAEAHAKQNTEERRLKSEALHPAAAATASGHDRLRRCWWQPGPGAQQRLGRWRALAAWQAEGGVGGQQQEPHPHCNGRTCRKDPARMAGHASEQEQAEAM